MPAAASPPLSRPRGGDRHRLCRAGGARRSQPFGVAQGTGLWPAKVAVAEREPAWFRREVNKVMAGVPPTKSPVPDGKVTMALQREKVVRGRRAFAPSSGSAPGPIRTTTSSTVPNSTSSTGRQRRTRCSSPSTASAPSRAATAPRRLWWRRDTEPLRWSIRRRHRWSSSAPTAAVSRCNSCGTKSSHADPVVLARLKDVPAL